MSVNDQTPNLLAHSLSTQLATSVTDGDEESQNEGYGLYDREESGGPENRSLPPHVHNLLYKRVGEGAGQVKRDPVFFLRERVPHHENEVNAEAHVEVDRHAEAPKRDEITGVCQHGCRCKYLLVGGPLVDCP